MQPSQAMSRYEPGSPQRRLWCSLPTDEFVRLDELQTFGLTSTTVLLRVKPPVDSIPMIEEPLASLPFGNIVAVTCASLLVAYQITVPHCIQVRVGTNFASFLRKKSPSLDTQTYMVDKKITVVGNGDAMLAVSSLIRWTSR